MEAVDEDKSGDLSMAEFVVYYYKNFPDINAALDIAMYTGIFREVIRQGDSAGTLVSPCRRP